MARTPRGPRDASGVALDAPRPSRRLLALAVVLVVAAFGSLASTPAGRAETGHRASVDRMRIHVPKVFFGMHDSSLQAYGRISFGSVRLWDAGVSWKDVETAPGVYDFDRLDALVGAAQDHGAQVTLVLAMTPAFYSSSPTLPPTDLSHFADYVRAVMTRYRSFNGSRGISSYQVWNEGNVPTFWTGTAYQLAQLTAVVDDVRDAVDPRARVVGPSFAVRLPYQRQWLSAYASQHVDGAPVWRFLDANALSLYPKARYGGRIGGPEDAMRLLARAKRHLTGAGVPAGLPIWATEVNYGVGSSPDGPVQATPIGERRQVANVMRTYLLGAARGLARIFWYRYDWDTVPSLGGATLGNTLLAAPGRWDHVTPAGRALTTVERWMHGRLVGVHGHRPCAQDRRGTYVCVVADSRGLHRVMWNPRHTVRVQVRGARFRQTPGGARTALRHRRASVAVGFRPVLVVSRR